MIICHSRRLIFLKGRKVGGTAVEIGLSTLCGPLDVVTPLTDADERLRRAEGGQGPCNHQSVRWPGHLRRRDVTFRNHSTAAQVRAQVPASLWSGYLKVGITRDPFEVAISRYHWRRAQGAVPEDMDFGAFVAAQGKRLSANLRIAPVVGPDRMDLHLRYARLGEDLAGIGLDEVAAVVARIRPKGDARPPEARCDAVYRQFPEAARIVAEACAAEIAAFGYPSPI
ncbi:MAG: hypothetical protein VX874_01820 [Pseudomonadota bacterium]|nr:hypothetical protein [Pseudomonadota bacterium]